MKRDFKIVDVFSSTPLKGNPVAVVLDAENLDTEEMQAVARWTNLSETTFILPPTLPTASYRLRIFTPRNELSFAGHPTLGSAFAALEAGRIHPSHGKVIQECGVGTVDIRISENRLFLELPHATLSPLAPEIVTEIETILGQPVSEDMPPAIVDIGITWIIACMKNADDILSLNPDQQRLLTLSKKLKSAGLTVFGKQKPSEETHIEVRTFAPACGVEEDPVCGSGNGCVAAFLREYDANTSTETGYVAAQEQCVGRNGRLFVNYDNNSRIQIGGACITTVSGQIVL